MARISEITGPERDELLRSVDAKSRNCVTVEEAAQGLVDRFYEAYEESLILIRLFVTIPSKELPQSARESAIRLANSKGCTEQLDEDTPMHTLLGSRGVEPAWNDPSRSQSHAAIPLVSADFIESAPMMSRLLKAMGLELQWLDGKENWMIARNLGKLGGVFYVPDATTAVDFQERKIIAAQDFVTHYGVKTVFGIGAGYMAHPAFTVLIAFTRETILDRGLLERLLPLAGSFNSATVLQMSEGRIFSRRGRSTPS